MKTATLPCADNVKKTVTLGIPTYESEYAYRNGQCLALAVEVAKTMESASVALFIRSDGGLFHAATFDESTERYVDYRGWWDAEEFEEYHSFNEGNSDESYDSASEIEYLSVDEAIARESSIALLPKQNYRVAATFVKDVVAGSVVIADPLLHGSMS